MSLGFINAAANGFSPIFSKTEPFLIIETTESNGIKRSACEQGERVS